MNGFYNWLLYLSRHKEKKKYQYIMTDIELNQVHASDIHRNDQGDVARSNTATILRWWQCMKCKLLSQVLYHNEEAARRQRIILWCDVIKVMYRASLSVINMKNQWILTRLFRFGEWLTLLRLINPVPSKCYVSKVNICKALLRSQKLWLHI